MYGIHVLETLVLNFYYQESGHSIYTEMLMVKVEIQDSILTSKSSMIQLHTYCLVVHLRKLTIQHRVWYIGMLIKEQILMLLLRIVLEFHYMHKPHLQHLLM